MNLNYRNLAVNPVLKAFAVLQHLMSIAERHCQEKGLAETDLIHAKLYDDMFDLDMQIAAAIMFSVRGLYSIVDKPSPAIESDNQSFAELRQRLDKATEAIKSLTAEEFVAAEGKPAESIMPVLELSYENGFDLLQEWTLPNLYFHVTTTYDILRHNGVALGKQDYLGPLTGNIKMRS